MADAELLTAAQAAARLGVKRQTLYAYVSRGTLHRTVAMDGRTSLFDPAEIEKLRLGKGERDDGELRTLIATSITHVDDDALLIRGRDLVELVTAPSSFLDVVDVLWESPEDESWPTAKPDLQADVAGLDGLRIIVAVASSRDELRHDLSPRGVRSASRQLILAMIHGLEPLGSGSDRTPSHALWRRLTSRRGTAAERLVLDRALGLLVDHGLASSTFGARVAASVRADPYSVVSTGLGAVGGTLHGAASARVHLLLDEIVRRDDAAAAVGAVLRDSDMVPGFGHIVYKRQDPRYAPLMGAVIDAWSSDPRLQHVYRLRDVVGERRSDLPNIDLALGAFSWLAGMAPNAGETIFAISRTAGWIAHALEEYGEAPLRLRPKARYLGPR